MALASYYLVQSSTIIILPVVPSMAKLPEDVNTFIAFFCLKLLEIVHWTESKDLAEFSPYPIVSEGCKGASVQYV